MLSVSPGSAKNISRNHAEITYVRVDLVTGYWQCVCSGKNGLQLNEEFRGPNENIRLRHRDRLSIGDTVFHFLEPIPMSLSTINKQLKDDLDR